MNELLPYLITGVVTGSLYGLSALGLVLSYRTAGVFNFGHGAVAAAAATIFYSLHITHGMAWPLAALITIALFGVVVGCAMEVITRRLNDVSEVVVVVATVGVMLGVQGYLFWQFGNIQKVFPDFLPTSGFEIQGVKVTWAQVISVGVATASAIGLYLFLQTARLGVAMRAVVDNPTLVALSGDNPRRVRQASWVISCAFAALSGILLAPTLGLNVSLLALLVVQAFGAAAIGRFSSLPFTYLGGFVVGISASLATKYFTEPPLSGLASSMPFVILLAVLLLVPAKHFPKRIGSTRSLIVDAPPTTRTVGALRAGAVVLALVLVPTFAGTQLPAWTAGLSYVILFASLGLLIWTSGQISLCHSAFAAVGVCAMGHLTGTHHVPWLLGVLLAGLITMPVGAIVAIPTIRLSGIYLALATLGFGILMQQVFFSTNSLFGADLTVSAPRPDFAFVDGSSDKHFYYVILTITLLSLGTVALIARSRLGRLLRAMSETPTMLATHGLGVNLTRLTVFCVSAFFAGVAGALLVSQFGTSTSSGYGPIQSLMFVAVLAICGTRLLRGAILAGGVFAVTPSYFTSFSVDRQTLVFGVVALLAALYIAYRDRIGKFVDLRAARTSDRWNRSSRPLRPAVVVPARSEDLDYAAVTT